MELVDQQRLVGVLSGQTVRRVADHHVHRQLCGQIPQPFQRRADQAGTGTSSSHRSAASVNAAVWDPIVCSSFWRAEDTQA